MSLAQAKVMEVSQNVPEPERRIKVMVRSVTCLAEDIRSFELVAPDRGPLPAFTAGAHVDVHLPGGLIRQYSLCGDPADRRRYIIAVLRERQGRGGSAAMHEVMPGAELTISRPRNHFPLAPNGRRHLLIAGGIGITPMMAMAMVLRARGEDFHLYCCTRSPARTAFLDELETLVAEGRATLHHDGGDPAAGLDFGEVVGKWEPGTHLYYCGPNGFMAALERASETWPREAVHFERFTAPDRPVETPAEDGGRESFDIRLARTGEVFTVESGQSIVEVLRENGIDVDVSCEEGYCGTCMTRYLNGEPLHRDTVLDDEDRRQYVMICCARSRSECLELDL